MSGEQTSTRKALILLASVDEATADSLLAQMPADQGAALRMAAASLGSIDPVEQREVLDEFYRKSSPGAPASAVTKNGHSSGSSHAAQQRVAASPTYTAPTFGAGLANENPSKRAFEFLIEADDRELVPLLRGERPQIIALVLAHLPPRRAAIVLGELPKPIQVDVLRRIADLEDAHPDVVRDVAHSLAVRWTTEMAQKERRPEGFELVTKILQAADRDLGDALLSSLGEQDARLVRLARPAAPEYEELTQLDNRSLTELLAAADQQIVFLAYMGSDPEFAVRMQQHAPKGLANAMRHTPAVLGPLNLEDIESAQSELAELALQLSEAGRIQWSPSGQRTRTALVA